MCDQISESVLLNTDSWKGRLLEASKLGSGIGITFTITSKLYMKM